MKICYIVLTCEKYIDTRVEWQKRTMFKNVDPQSIYYLGHTLDLEKRIYSWGAKDDYHSLPYKYYDFFRNMNLDYDWYVLLDDDTFIYPTRLAKALSDYSPDNYVAHGCVLKHIEHTPWGSYFSGGAGTILSNALYRSLCSYLRNVPPAYEPPHWCADISVSMWIKNIENVIWNHSPLYCPDMYHASIHSSSQMISFHHLRSYEDYLLCDSISE